MQSQRTPKKQTDSTELTSSFSDYLAQDEVQKKLAENRAGVQRFLAQRDQLIGEICRIFNDLPGNYSVFEKLASEYLEIKSMNEADSAAGVAFEETTWLNLVVGSAYYDLFDDQGVLLPKVKEQLDGTLIDALKNSIGESAVNNAIISSYLQHMAAVLSADPKLIALDKSVVDKTSSPLIVLGLAFNSLVNKIQADTKSIRTYKEALIVHASQPILASLKKSIVSLNIGFTQRNQPVETPHVAAQARSAELPVHEEEQNLAVLCESLRGQLRIQTEKLQRYSEALERLNLDRDKVERQLLASARDLAELRSVKEDLTQEQSKKRELETLAEHLSRSIEKIKVKKTDLELALQEKQSKVSELEVQLKGLQRALETARSQTQLTKNEFDERNKELVRQLSDVQVLLSSQKINMEQLVVKNKQLQMKLFEQTKELAQLRPLKEELSALQHNYLQLTQSSKEKSKELEKRDRELQRLNEEGAARVVIVPASKSEESLALAAAVDANKKLRKQNAVLRLANLVLRTQLEQSQQRVPVPVAPPVKTPWWKYALAAVGLVVGVFALATGVGAAIAAPILALSISTAFGIGMAVTGAAIAISSGVYMGVLVRADQRAQEVYTEAVKQPALVVVAQRNQGRRAQLADFRMGRAVPLETPSVLPNSFYRPTQTVNASVPQPLAVPGLARAVAI